MITNYRSYLLSIVRIIIGILIFFSPVYSPMFITLFLITGFIDFYGERLLKLDSEVYGKDKMLNSIGTIMFILAGCVKLIPELFVSSAVYAWLILIGLLIIWNQTAEIVLYGHLIYVDSYATRVVKLLIYTFPLLTQLIEKEFLCIVICIVSTFAEIQIGHLVRMKTTEREILGLNDKK